MKTVALITLHGMGERKDDYHAGLHDRLARRLGDAWPRVSFQAVNYAEILQGPQDALWADMQADPNNNLDFVKLRKFFLFGFGDAGSLEHSAHRDPTKYLAVQSEIQRALGAAFGELTPASGRPVVIVAQSLGCQVISNYLWDAQHDKYSFAGTGGDHSDLMEFLRLKSLAHLVTTGCNIPLFVAGLSPRLCFAPPNEKFAWDNYYDADDVLGWPLRQLDPSYAIVRDHEVNAGGILTSWNPYSHGKYWEDRDVIDPLVDSLRRFV